ncbi:MAG: hypothetical protein JWL95_891 [Gemmatimonadetes bacterium]|nr:hypothetical protein [Gemmatimonadota bacterium]
MDSDAGQTHSHHAAGWSAARRQSELTLLRTLDQARSAEDERTKRALHAFVEVLVAEDLTPEATLIALKGALLRADFLIRCEPLVREHLRETLISECIDHYFASGRSADIRAGATRSEASQRDSSNADDADPL